MRIIELEKNEIPEKSSDIFPKLGIQSYRYKRKEGSDELTYIFAASFLVKILRDGVEYLIPVRDSYEFKREDKYVEYMNKFVTKNIMMALDIQDKFVVDGVESIVLPDGVDAFIYKYKQ